MSCQNGKGCVVNSDCQNAELRERDLPAAYRTGRRFADQDRGLGVGVLRDPFGHEPVRIADEKLVGHRQHRSSTIYDSWNGNFPANTGTFAITPGFTWNQAIGPGATNNSVGFCANRTPASSGANAVVVSASGSF